MTSAFVEKLARAGAAYNAEQGFTTYTWDTLGEDTGREQYRGIVRAILTAMREPSEEMANAALEVADWSEQGFGDDDAFNKQNSVYRWQAMIDAALADKP